eukprot:Awhi_evm1s15230
MSVITKVLVAAITVNTAAGNLIYKNARGTRLLDLHTSDGQDVTVDQCADLCHLDEDCVAFDYTKYFKLCYFHDLKLSKTVIYKDFYFDYYTLPSPSKNKNHLTCDDWYSKKHNMSYNFRVFPARECCLVKNECNVGYEYRQCSPELCLDKLSPLPPTTTRPPTAPTPTPTPTPPSCNCNPYLS